MTGNGPQSVAPDTTSLATRLARLRVPLGFLFGALVLWLASPTARTLAIGGAVACTGEALRIWAAGHLNKALEVTSSGPYRWIAHPLYTGSAVMGAGLAIASGSIVVTVLIATYLVVTLTAAIKSEEAFLSSRFGSRYDRYRDGHRGDPDRAFSMQRALSNREQRAVTGLALAILVLALKATYNGTFWQPGG